MKKIVKTDAEWRARLDETQYQVTRHHKTERAWSGKYARNKDDGIYQCVCCGQALFDSETKYESGTGWPSFWEPIASEAVGVQIDRGLLLSRTEVHCARCDAHLGHVFEDGPEPTGLRYCMNSASLDLAAREGDSPAAEDAAKDAAADGPESDETE